MPAIVEVEEINKTNDIGYFAFYCAVSCAEHFLNWSNDCEKLNSEISRQVISLLNTTHAKSFFLVEGPIKFTRRPCCSNGPAGLNLIKIYNLFVITHSDEVLFFECKPNAEFTFKKIDQLCGKGIQSICCGKGLGVFHGLALSDQGEVYPWGSNRAGELGLGLIDNEFHMSPEKVPLNGHKIKMIACGLGASYALSETGELFAWGSNNHGQIGVGDIIGDKSVSTPIIIDFSHVTQHPIESVYAFGMSAYAIDASGDLFEWGYNSNPRYDHGSDKTIRRPTHVPFPSPVKVLQAGLGLRLAVLEDETCWIWGNIEEGKRPIDKPQMISLPSKEDFTIIQCEEGIALFQSKIFQDIAGRFFDLVTGKIPCPPMYYLSAREKQPSQRRLFTHYLFDEIPLEGQDPFKRLWIHDHPVNLTFHFPMPTIAADEQESPPSTSTSKLEPQSSDESSDIPTDEEEDKYSDMEESPTAAELDPSPSKECESDHDGGTLEYPIHSRDKRGHCLILNHEQYSVLGPPSRWGTNHDAERLEVTFKELGFKIHRHDNLRKMEIMDAVERLALNINPKSSCLIICILTHGRPGNKLWARDKMYQLEDIVNRFGGDRCPALAGKPKLIFIQACRGDSTDVRVQMPTDMATSSRVTLRSDLTSTQNAPGFDFGSAISSQGDFFIGWSTPPGFVAHRDPDTGTPFIQALSEEIDAAIQVFHRKRRHLVDIFMRVTDRVAREFDTSSEGNKLIKQTPAYYSTLRKYVFLPPAKA